MRLRLFKASLFCILVFSLYGCYELRTGETVPIYLLVTDYDSTYRKPYFECGFYDSIHESRFPTLPENTDWINEKSIRIVRWTGKRTAAYWINPIKFTSSSITLCVTNKAGYVMEIQTFNLPASLPENFNSDSLTLHEVEKGGLSIQCRGKFYSIDRKYGQFSPERFYYRKDHQNIPELFFPPNQHKRVGYIPYRYQEELLIGYQSDSIGYGVFSLYPAKISNDQGEIVIEKEVTKYADISPTGFNPLHYYHAEDSKLNIYTPDTSYSVPLTLHPFPRGNNHLVPELNAKLRNTLFETLPAALHSETPVLTYLRESRKYDNGYEIFPDNFNEIGEGAFRVIRFVGYDKFISSEQFHKKQFAIHFDYLTDGTEYSMYELCKLLITEQTTNTNRYVTRFWTRRIGENTHELVMTILKDVVRYYEDESHAILQDRESINSTLYECINYEITLHKNPSDRAVLHDYLDLLEDLGQYQSVSTMLLHKLPYEGGSTPSRNEYERLSASPYREPGQYNQHDGSWVVQPSSYWNDRYSTFGLISY